MNTISFPRLIAVMALVGWSLAGCETNRPDEAAGGD